jgi:hypothetical protein
MQATYVQEAIEPFSLTPITAQSDANFNFSFPSFVAKLAVGSQKSIPERAVATIIGSSPVVQPCIGTFCDNFLSQSIASRRKLCIPP